MIGPWSGAGPVASPVAVPRDRSEMRRFVREHHPDVGGDPEAFAEVMARYQRFRLRRDVRRDDVVYVYRRRRGVGVLLDAYLRRREARRRGPRVL